MAGVLQGKLIEVRVNGSNVRCQTDSTLSITIDTSDDDACKPTEADSTNGSSWITHNVTTKKWTISVSAKAFADQVSGRIDNSDIVNMLTTGTPNVEITFQTTRTLDYDFNNIFLYEGSGTITSFTHNAPISGESTYDLEVIGNGALTYTVVNIRPTVDLFFNGILQDNGILNDLEIYNLT